MLIKDHMLHGKEIHQRLYKFPNGFGASVVIGEMSHGYSQGLFELCVVKFKHDSEEYDLCYTTTITDDTLGYLSESDVQKVLKRIENISGHSLLLTELNKYKGVLI